MRTMHWVTRLKCHHIIPTMLRNFITDLHGGTKRTWKISFKITVAQNLNISGNNHITLRSKRSHPRMSNISCSEYSLANTANFFVTQLLNRIHSLNSNNRIALNIRITQRNLLT